MKKIFAIILLFVLLFITGCKSQVTVTFDSNGGTPVESATILYGGVVTQPEDPIKGEFDFIGWYYNDAIFDFSTKLYFDITLVAKYNEGNVNIYTVVFKDYDGTVLKTENVEEGDSATAPNDPSREGYKFIGWNLDFSNVSSDLEVVAKYANENAKVYTVVFKDYDGTILKTENVEEGTDATQPQPPTRDGYVFSGWSLEFTNVTSDLEVVAQYIKTETSYLVTFMNYNGQVLKTETVKAGGNATAPENPKREGYIFTGWQGSYSNVQGNVTIRAQYVSIDKEYKINYVMNNGIWDFSSKSEGVYYFLKDFYDFVKPTESLKTFIFGESNNEYLGTWKDYIGGCYGDNNKLLYNNDLDANNDNYFFNSSTYKNKWNELGKWIAQLNNRFNGTDYYYGALDFYRYITNNPDQYINVYGQEFYGFPKMNQPFTTYTYSEQEIELPAPLSESFKGWYLNSDFTGEKITHIKAKQIGDIELYAAWDFKMTYEVYLDSAGAQSYDPITATYNTEISLPTPSKDGYTFIGWYIGDTYIGTSFVYEYPYSITLVAKWRNNNVTLEKLKYDGTNVTYRNSSTAVEIPTDYVQPAAQLRAAWLSSYASTFKPSPDEATMKANLTAELDMLEKYNMNCMIFHIRTTNNAFYQTDLAPIDVNYGTYESFKQWDYLEWLIDECHKRGIEFHAWLNPYRIKAYGYPADSTPETVAAQYANYPKNPASDPENILMTYRDDGTKGAILNPYEEVVQDYIVDVCLEVMEKYDVDAIHFDDYFYAQMTKPINVLKEPDQDDYIEYISNNPNSGYSVSSASDKKQWRRDNIDNFIYKLSTAMTAFNIENGRGVQLGISPTGIYRNGNGSVSSGSNTAGQEHYESYLFCDTVNWINNEWIDYIMPQSYWAFTHKVAGYADVMDWWNKVVDGTQVNLYSGLGLYMSVSGGNYSWGTQPYEISNQILYTTKLENVKGVSIYSFLSLKQVDGTPSRIAYKGLMRVKNEYWTEKVPTPQTKAHQYIK